MGKILVVDDERANRSFLRTLLGYAGHQVIEAEGARDGLQLTRSERPDLVIADLLMPGIDGYQFVRELRTDHDVGNTAVVFYTAFYNDDRALQLAYSCGVRHILTKPAEPEAILDLINTLLRPSSANPSVGSPEEFDDLHLTFLSDRLCETAGALRATNVQLKALIQLGQQLAAEYDPQKLVECTCVAARSLLNCAYAGVATVATSSLSGYVTVRGPDPSVNALLQEFLQTPGSLDWVYAEGETLKRAPAETGSGSLPRDLAVFAVPMARPSGPVGTLLVANATTQPVFGEAEGEIAALIAAQAAVSLENAARLLLLERRTADLQTEVNQRKRLHDEVRQLNSKLAASVAALTASNNDLEVFTYSLAHDLRAPIRHIDAYSQILFNELGPSLQPAMSRYFHSMRQNATQMAGMIDDLLRLARTGRMPVKKELLDLNHLVEEVRRELDPEFQNRRIEWRVGTLPSVEVDYTLIHLVFTNLISNALKFTRPKETATIDVGRLESATAITIYVKDNGVGFDMKYADKLFGIFQRLHPADQFEGTGVGLATVHRVMQKLEGRVWAESEPGVGSTFFFTIGAPTDAVAAGRVAGAIPIEV